MTEFKSYLPEIKLVKEPTDFKRIKVSSSAIAADYIRQFYGTDIEMYESFFILLMNQANNTIGYVKISQGGIIGTVVDLRIVAKYAIESLATSVILAHNHPSGNLVPSAQDKELTRKIKEGLHTFDIKVFDHIILSPEKGMYLSFADDNIAGL